MLGVMHTSYTTDAQNDKCTQRNHMWLVRVLLCLCACVCVCKDVILWLFRHYF